MKSESPEFDAATALLAAAQSDAASTSPAAASATSAPSSFHPSAIGAVDVAQLHALAKGAPVQQTAQGGHAAAALGAAVAGGALLSGRTSAPFHGAKANSPLAPANATGAAAEEASRVFYLQQQQQKEMLQMHFLMQFQQMQQQQAAQKQQQMHQAQAQQQQQQQQMQQQAAQQQTQQQTPQQQAMQQQAALQQQMLAFAQQVNAQNGAAAQVQASVAPNQVKTEQNLFGMRMPSFEETLKNLLVAGSSSYGGPPLGNPMLNPMALGNHTPAAVLAAGGANAAPQQVVGARTTLAAANATSQNGAMGSSYSWSRPANARPRRNENFTSFQYFVLERVFIAKPYPEYRRLNEYEIIAKAIGLEPNQVRIWFQNRRSRQRAKMLRGEVPRQTRFGDDAVLAAQAMPVVRQLEAVLCPGEKSKFPDDDLPTLNLDSLEGVGASDAPQQGVKRPRDDEDDALSSASSSRRSSFAVASAPSAGAIGADRSEPTTTVNSAASSPSPVIDQSNGPETTTPISQYILEAMAVHNVHPTPIETTTIAAAVEMDTADVASWFAKRAKSGTPAVPLSSLVGSDASRVATTVNTLRQVVRPGPTMSASRARAAQV